MLTAFQCDIVAYSTENGPIVCPDCAFPREPGEGLLNQIIRYTANECEDGLICDDCGKQISEPHLKYLRVTLRLEVDRDTDESDVESELTSHLDSLDYVQRVSSVDATEE